MENKMFTHPDSGMVVIVDERKEWRSCFDDEDGITERVRHVRVKTADGECLKSWQYTCPVMGKGRTAQITEHVSISRDWIHAYWHRAKYPSVVKCNCVVRSTGVTFVCQNLRAGDDGRAKCAILPDVEGYSWCGTGSRDVPTNLTCDISMTVLRQIDSRIPGYPLSLYDMKMCDTGQALLQISRSDRS